MGYIFIGLLLVLVLPIIAIVTAIGARSRIDRLEMRLAELEKLLGGKERAPEKAAVAESEAAPLAKPEPQPETAQPPPAKEEPAPPKTAQAADGGFEKQFGTRWVVWAGGLALALGGIFLVRYSIQQGWLGPGVRIFLGALLATVLIAAGEWTRRKEQLSDLAGLPAANIPSVLTAAGTVTAFGTVYAAYALYNFLLPPSAFLLLGIVAVATLVASLLHGPALAALGLVGAYLTPLLVTAEVPNYWALYIYLAVVTGAAFALARVRLWRWLAVTAIVLGVLWMFPGIQETSALAAHAFHAVAGFALAAIFLVVGLLYGPDEEQGRVDAISSASLAAYLFAAAVLVTGTHHDGLALAIFAALTAASVAIAWRAEAATGAVPAAAAFAVLVMAQWAARIQVEHLIASAGHLAGAVPEPEKAETGLHLVLGAGFAGLFGIAGFLAQGRSKQPLAPMLWAGTAVLAPVAILIALYYRIAGFDRSIPFAALALLLAALFAVAAEILSNRNKRPGLASATAIFAAGSVASLALALTLALEKGWLTVALSLMVPGIAYVASKRPLPLLRKLTIVLGAVVLARIVWDPRIVGADVGTTPVLNWLLWGYGVPAASFWLAGNILRRRGDDLAVAVADALAILFTGALLLVEIRHYITGGDLNRRIVSFAELALDVSAGFAMSIAIERFRDRIDSIVYRVSARLIFGGTLAAALFGLLIARNPYFTGQPVGGSFFNLVLLGYGLPAALAFVFALMARSQQSMRYRMIAAGEAVILALAYLTLEVRTLYRGPVLGGGFISDAEQYTYSIVWLAFGVALLIAGILLNSKPARLASAAVVMLTVAKVFLVDIAGLQGAYQALSFIGLGVVLLGIGWFYQRLLFPERAAQR
jgi:uncharacterized membrane protein